jgi:hypothetical protein
MMGPVEPVMAMFGDCLESVGELWMRRDVRGQRSGLSVSLSSLEQHQTPYIIRAHHPDRQLIVMTA